MKTPIISLSILLVAVACGGNKQAQLEALKKQHDKIGQKIEKLEQEIAAASDSTDKTGVGTFVSVNGIKLQPFNHYIEVQGKLDGDENVAVYPEAMGVLIEVTAKVGEKVKVGQVLARINDATYQDQLKSLQANYALALDTYQKQESLWNQHIGSEMQYLQAKTNKESMEAQLATLKKQIDMTRIKSPITGEIEESLVKVGQGVSPSMPAFRVVNFSNLKVTADVSEAYNAKVHKGDQVIVYFPDINKEVKAHISFCSDYINPTNRTFGVEALLNTSTENLKANMVAVLRINDYNNADAVVLPINMIQTDKEGQYVLVAVKENNAYVAKRQAVHTGQIYNGLAEITTGLEPGAKVITNGYLSLNQGQAIRF